MPDENLPEQVVGLIKSGKRRTALNEVMRHLRHDPNNPRLLDLALTIVSASRTVNLKAAEPVTEQQWNSAILAPIATECSSCQGMWYSTHGMSAFAGVKLTGTNPVGLQCQDCRYTLCRDCLPSVRPAPDDPLDFASPVSGHCREPSHGRLSTPVLPTGRSDVESQDPDSIEAVIVARSGPIPPTMDEALAVVTKFVPLIPDDTALIHIRSSKPGFMDDRPRRDELAAGLIGELEGSGALAPGAWNRATPLFIEPGQAPDTSYLVTVVRKPAEIDPHPLYGLYSGMSLETLASIAGKPPPSAIRNDRWMYTNTPSGLDTSVVVSRGVVQEAEMHSREDGALLLRVDSGGTYTVFVGHAVFALFFLLAFTPELSEQDVRRDAPLPVREILSKEELVGAVARMLRSWEDDPGHTTFGLTRKDNGVLVVSDPEHRCGFWRLTGDRFAVGSLGSRSYAGLTAAELTDLVARHRQSSHPPETAVRRVLEELRREYGHPAYPFAASLERLAFGTAGPPLYQESLEPDEVDVIDGILHRLSHVSHRQS
jgi:hypothetical protein